jgi:hypothetical protein
MTSRGTSFVLIAVVVSMVGLALPRGAARPSDAGLDPLPVYGSVLPTGDFVGTLKIVAFTLDDAGHLRLSGVLNGTATHRTGARIPVTLQPFTAPATLRDPGRTTDVLRLAVAPIALDPLGLQIRLAPITSTSMRSPARAIGWRRFCPRCEGTRQVTTGIFHSATSTICERRYDGVFATWYPSPARPRQIPAAP